MLTDIIVPLCKNGSRVNDTELRFCLRSVEKHLTNVGNIYVIGEEVPYWLQNVIHIRWHDNTNNWMRAHNIYSKIMAAIDYKNKVIKDFDLTSVSITGYGFEAAYNIKDSVLIELSNNFLFLNDDHFLMTDYVLPNFPYYHGGPIDLSKLEVNQPQLKQMRNTLVNAKGSLNFDVHCPIMYNKSQFVAAFADVPKEWPEHGYGIKSMYGNALPYDTQIVQIEDCKIYKSANVQEIARMVSDRPWFSTGDAVMVLGEMVEFLEMTYPVPSKYEI